LLPHCSCAGAVSFGFARACIADGALFPLQIACTLESGIAPELREAWGCVSAPLHAPLYFPCILQGTARNSASGRDGARLQRDSDIGRRGFVRREAENGCIYFDLASWDGSDGHGALGRPSVALGEIPATLKR
jgi:hypothetical protein